MSKKKLPQAPKKTEVSIVRSSAAEYLTFVAATGGGSDTVEMRYEDENLWLTQKMMATLYDVSVPAISQHLKRIYADNELEREATVKPYLMVQTEGEREVQRKVEHYSLQAIIAVGFKIENERAVQFRKWANRIVKDYTIHGWVYHWLRSPLGEQCILSLARGAVRERMLFNRLADGEIELPDFTDQHKAAAALKELKPVRKAIRQQLREIDLLPQKILAQAFGQQESP